ncbi:hypothetical protein ACFWPQ_01920 [Streptomyces sp. NPDC058464]|uniref:hypothetical protein n=1 Tax=Streptomyces sp. NPDC058464 TaxID=3346511 RepID=UPI0036534322
MDIPENLIELERAAEQERVKLDGLAGEEYDEQRRRWRDAAAAAQAAITQYATAEGASRVEVEMAAKKAARHDQHDG